MQICEACKSTPPSTRCMGSDFETCTTGGVRLLGSCHLVLSTACWTISFSKWRDCSGWYSTEYDIVNADSDYHDQDYDDYEEEEHDDDTEDEEDGGGDDDEDEEDGGGRVAGWSWGQFQWQRRSL